MILQPSEIQKGAQLEGQETKNSATSVSARQDPNTNGEETQPIHSSFG